MTWKLVSDSSSDLVTGQLTSSVADFEAVPLCLRVGEREFWDTAELDIPELLAAMDLFLLPSLFEGLPVTLIETQASGLPALVSDRVTREMDKVGLIRFLPLDDDASSWCDAILNAGVNEDRFAYARKMLEAGYDISDQAYKLGAFYHRRYSYK